MWTAYWKCHTLINDPGDPEKLPEESKGQVVFDHVSFRYPGAEEDVLEDISFTAEPGQTTAIIGSTGCGKSTLVNLIPRFYDVTEGSIRLDGHDIRNLTQHDLREKLGYVPQKGVLFSGDIASNILFGNPDGTDEEMEEAARIAQATEFIEAKKRQYHSHIAQGGSNVSGGQKQRLSIARAIAKHPAVYIFDDSFSALDYKTDVALRGALKEKNGRQYRDHRGSEDQYDHACGTDPGTGRWKDCGERYSQRTFERLSGILSDRIFTAV